MPASQKSKEGKTKFNEPQTEEKEKRILAVAMTK
jgi:hypothetical protein